VKIDLLFYHVRRRCHVIIDVKMVEFEPEFAGKMNFYLSAVDDLLRHPDDQPTTGIILCKSKNKVKVARRGSRWPTTLKRTAPTSAPPPSAAAMSPRARALPKVRLARHGDERQHVAGEGYRVRAE